MRKCEKEVRSLVKMPELKHVDIYTDGACSGNPGAGGWAAILIYKGVEKQVSGYNKDTTNNRMELFAIIQGLRQLKERCDVTVVSDSAYATDPFCKAGSRVGKRTIGAPPRKTT